MSTKKALFPCHVLNILKFILLGIVIEERLETLIFGFSMEKKVKVLNIFLREGVCGMKMSEQMSVQINFFCFTM